ncbi:CBS domain-containing protein [Sporolactobacillus terrae]|uniref:CBS domain-containing protein n=1 Tax=Sporolactobacillus terrae TaxID=269673 RepID=A0A410D8J4_9BACL|nr:CBS domain-containing protein [Sporolactobacillus terrae]QAA22404.1 CBS domain-containing protein [Sporolactobacillus terrae]QAA25379.1 CBS domain-containing protein [Sporolactobacillus terrae]UAK17189.1 CBS domain-containing protein [Sporolactobacillus terrae]BBN98722.1 CBS domain-containing protein [Sporolactobacillus terrae]
MLVEQLMLNHVVTITETDSLKAFIKLMIDHKIGGAPVVNFAHQLVGYISDGDVLRKMMPKQKTIYDLYSLIEAIDVEISQDKLKDLLDLQVNGVMKKRNVQTVRREQDIDAVLRILSHHHIKQIPVVDDERHVVGLVSRSQIIRHIGDQLIHQ